MTTIVAGKVAIVTGAGRGIGRGIALLMAAEGARVVVCDIGAGLDGGGSDAGPAQGVVDEIKKSGGEAITSTASISTPGNADKIVQAALDAFGRVDILVNNAGILRDRIFHRMSWSDWSDVIDVHLHGSFAMSRACATHFREQNSGSFVHMTSTSGLVGNFGQANYMAAKMGIVGLSRGIALDMARFNVRSNCVAPFAWTRMIDSIPAETDEEKARVAAFRADDAGENRAARRLSRLRPSRRHQRPDFFGAQQRDLSFQSDPSDPHAASLRRLDAGTARCSAQRGVCRVVHAARPFERRVFLGPGVMAIIYDKLMALDIPPREQSYEAKDCILYALGIGFGHDPMNEDELPFVYEKNLKVLPTMGTVLGHPGFWARNRDTGIDWVRVVNGEQGITLHRPIAGAGTVIGRQRIVEVIDKGAGKGALVLSERKITDKASGEPIATVTHTMFCRGDGGFGGPPREAPAPHELPRARAGCGLRSRHAAGSGADLPAERRSQSDPLRTRRGKTSRISAPDHARSRQFRHRCARGSEDLLRLRSEETRGVRRAVFGAGVSRRDVAHRDVA